MLPDIVDEVVLHIQDSNRQNRANSTATVPGVSWARKRSSGRVSRETKKEVSGEGVVRDRR
jgi:hypothetical protein